MPIYTYSSDAGEVIEIESPLSAKRPETITRHGKTFRRDIAADHSGVRRSMLTGWPRVSSALGVHPKQIKEAMAADKKAGVPIDYAANGDAVFSCPEQQYRYMRAMGFVDRNGVRSGKN